VGGFISDLAACPDADGVWKTANARVSRARARVRILTDPPSVRGTIVAAREETPPGNSASRAAFRSLEARV
jgi:hypothetical protein